MQSGVGVTRATAVSMPNQGKGQWKKRPNQQDGAVGSAANKKRKYFAAGNTAGLPLGSRGFLISCLGGKEQQAAFEASRLLQEVRLKSGRVCLPGACRRPWAAG